MPTTTRSYHKNKYLEIMVLIPSTSNSNHGEMIERRGSESAAFTCNESPTLMKKEL